MDLHNSRGQLVRLGAQIGKGGEGTVSEVIGHPNRVAKVYSGAVAAEKAEKLKVMAELKTERLLKLAAWPLDTLHERPWEPACGLLMPRVHGHKEAHVLYSPKSRITEFPTATWPFLIQTALNTAIAFSTIHEHGHVIGDVNHGNLLVSPRATTTLIDCDSFQIQANGRHYLCEVGVSTHTPPELQGKPFRGVVRTPNHDAFGLAVLIFQLLFMGRHPFSGTFLGRGDMSLEKAIQECRFAYGPGAGGRQMRPPPGTLPLSAVSDPVAQLFERAFSPLAVDGAGSGTRPSAREWAGALHTLVEAVKPCSRNAGHHYLSGLPECPWCEIETLSGARLFAVLVTGTAPASGNFHLDTVWSLITAVRSPAPPLLFPDRASLPVQPSPRTLRNLHHKKLRWIGSGAIMCVVMVFCVLARLEASGAFFVLLVGVAMGWLLVSHKPAEAEQVAHEALERAQRQWEAFERRWAAEATDERFRLKLAELERCRSEYLGLAAKRQRKLQELERSREERERQRYLDRFRIADAGVPGIGPTRTAELLSMGIETAADVDWDRICGQVPGFGPTRTQALVNWRDRLLRNFRFDPRRGISSGDLAALEAELAHERSRLERELRLGPTALRQVTEQIEASRRLLWPAAQEAMRTLVQAEQEVQSL